MCDIQRCIYSVLCVFFSSSVFYRCVYSTSSFRTFSIKQTVFFVVGCFVWVLSVMQRARRGENACSLSSQAFIISIFSTFLSVLIFFSSCSGNFHFKFIFSLSISTEIEVHWNRKRKKRKRVRDIHTGLTLNSPFGGIAFVITAFSEFCLCSCFLCFALPSSKFNYRLI